MSWITIIIIVGVVLFIAVFVAAVRGIRRIESGEEELEPGGSWGKEFFDKGNESPPPPEQQQ